ncbi:hypothetical protein Tco_1254226 [Tanacetum coccineum]
MASLNYCTLLSGGVPMWQARSLKSQAGCKRSVLTMDQCTSRLGVGRWALPYPIGLALAAIYTNMSSPVLEVVGHPSQHVINGLQDSYTFFSMSFKCFNSAQTSASSVSSFQNRVGKNCKSCLKDAPTSLKKWKDKFFLVDRRAVPIDMAWRHYDSIVSDPFPKFDKYNAPDVAKLHEVVIALRKPHPILMMAEFLQLPNFKGCKVAAGELLPPALAE